MKALTTNNQYAESDFSNEVEFVVVAKILHAPTFTYPKFSHYHNKNSNAILANLKSKFAKNCKLLIKINLFIKNKLYLI